jgi:putative sugar O-methyltransferase
MLFATLLQTSSFEETWHEMQQSYRCLCSEVQSYSTKDLFYHPQWKKFSAQIRALIMGIPNRNFLRHNAIAATMVRSGMKIGQTYEMCYLDQCISSRTKELLSRFKEENVFRQPKECSAFQCSSNTLGQLFYVARILENIDPESIHTITELGGGFGCLSYAFKLILPKANYHIIDIPELLAIQYLFLKSVLPHENIYLHVDSQGCDLEKKGIHLIPVHIIDELRLRSDVFVSNFALSEATNYVQRLVADKNFFDAKLAYITGQLDGWGKYGFEQETTIFETVNRCFGNVYCQPFHLILASLRSYEIIAKI